MLRMSRYWWLLLIGLIFLDQASKQLSVHYLYFNDPVFIFPGFNLSLAFNKGAAFSFLASAGGWQRWFFVGITVFISAIVLYWSNQSKSKLEQYSLCLILSGAIGNLIDRLLLGYVVDFLDFYYQDWHWYTFNIADSAICMGAFLMLWCSFRSKC